MTPITVKGDEQVAAGLAAIAAGLPPTEALKGTAELLEVNARGRAPKRSGALARSITGRVQGETATVGAAVPYGLPVHFGVPAHNQAAQPFLFQAVAATAAQVQTLWVKDTQALIDRSM